MAVTARRLCTGDVGAGSIGTLYTAPASTRTVIRQVALCNTTAGALTVDVYLVPSGSGATASAQVLKGFSVAAGATVEPLGIVGQVIEAGGSLRAQASGAGLTCVASGSEIAG
ncbi:hypothetical protein [Azospirillum argentinense]